MARQDAEAERARSLKFVKNRVNNLMKKAQEHFDAKKFESVVDITEQVLALDRTHTEARRLHKRARELRHLYEVTRSNIRTEEEWDNTFLNQLEAEVPYQKIFNFPPREEWIAISRKTLTLEERILRFIGQRFDAAMETAPSWRRRNEPRMLGGALTARRRESAVISRPGPPPSC